MTIGRLMIGLLLSLIVLSAGVEGAPVESPPVLFAPGAWSDPPDLDGFARCAEVHPNAVSLRADGTKPPVIHRAMPDETKGQGRVIAEVFVDHTGKLLEVRVLRAYGKEFVESALKELVTSKFEPGTSDGKPVPMCLTLTLRTEVRR